MGPGCEPRLVRPYGAAYAAGMTQPSRVIYLPPGVLPPPQATMPSGPAPSSGVPFDRRFFEAILPMAITSFCSQVDCPSPVVELLTIDGVTHYIKNIAGVADSWVALQTSIPDHDHPVQIFVPYQTIFRVGLHAAADDRRRQLGFSLDSARVAVLAIPEATAEAPSAAKGKARDSAKKNRT